MWARVVRARNAQRAAACRFGEIVACDVIRDRKTGDSLNYAFIGFTEKKAAEEAYLKMNNALIDDRCARLSLSISLSVSLLFSLSPPLSHTHTQSGAPPLQDRLYVNGRHGPHEFVWP